MTWRKTKARSREREAHLQLMRETMIETPAADFYPWVSRAAIRRRAAELREAERRTDSSSGAITWGI